MHSKEQSSQKFIKFVRTQSHTFVCILSDGFHAITTELENLQQKLHGLQHLKYLLSGPL